MTADLPGADLTWALYDAALERPRRPLPPPPPWWRPPALCDDAACQACLPYRQGEQ